MRRQPTLLIFALLLLAAPSLCQMEPVTCIAVAMPSGAGNSVPSEEIRDRLIKELSQRKADKKLTTNWHTIALDLPPGGRAVAEATRKNCGFVFYSNVTSVTTSYQFERTGDGSVRNSPMATATMEYLLRRLVDGASYASGVVKGEESFSDREAVLATATQVIREVISTLRKGGPRTRQALTSFDTTTPPADRDVTSDLCDWLPGSLPHGEALRGVCEFAMTLPLKMPNFVCEQETARYQGHSTTPADLITATIRYEEGDESYSDMRLNGKPSPDALEKEAGLWSVGQLGGNLRAIFHARNHALFDFSGETPSGERPAWVFTYHIARQDEPLWQLRGRDETIAPPYLGELWVDQKTGALLRFRSSTAKLPSSFSMRSAEVAIDYDAVTFSDGSAFVLPVTASIATSYSDAEPTRNVVQLRACHKFRAKARIVPDAAAKPEDAPPH